MCLRPDIIYVTTRKVYDDYVKFVCDTGLDGISYGFSLHFEVLINELENQGDEQQATHWRNVMDLGHRKDCSLLSAVEVDGDLIEGIKIPHWKEPENLIKVYIGNPLNPPHTCQQNAITVESMEIINQNIR